ncbi:hypothetical protein D9611_007760 [Ephemerocybe angulata]|uniref:Uncharacterized protein n=1 Tax=Ephemerocybe angulata TaxID=980116 RepID=A0A8H5CER2_9AGAR|nr:hypothetical protein D9611_007760 [Tulosesus angulatus]
MLSNKHVASTSNLSCLNLARQRHTLTSVSETRYRPLHHKHPPQCSKSASNSLRIREYSKIPSGMLISNEERGALASPISAPHPPTAKLSFELGLRTSKPPDTFSNHSDYRNARHTSTQNFSFTPRDSNSTRPLTECEEVSDQEWELRTGRAIFVLQETLPTFFQTGLTTSIDTLTGKPKQPNYSQHSHFHIPIIDNAAAASLEFLSSGATTSSSVPKGKNGNGNGKSKHPQTAEDDADEENIYSPNIRLQYTPPVALPAPFPKTFKLEGINLYLASSSIVRHSMNALFHDLSVTLVKVSVHNEPPPPSDGSASSSQSSPPPSGSRDSKRSPRKLNREKYLLVRQLVNGINRVSGKEAEWEVESMYTFSPLSGLIMKHTVNSIRPAPHLAVYDLLKGSLGQVFGFGEPAGRKPGVCASAVGVGEGGRGDGDVRK